MATTPIATRRKAHCCGYRRNSAPRRRGSASSVTSKPTSRPLPSAASAARLAYNARRRRAPFAAGRAEQQQSNNKEIVSMAVTKLSHVTIIVPDQNEALTWYTEKFGFEKRADDTGSMAGYRWLTVAPRGQTNPKNTQNQTHDNHKHTKNDQGTLWV